MKTYFALACVAIACATSACTIREERTVQPATAAVVAPVPSTVVYTDPVPASTTTTVYTR
jgi:hypothetical protein